MWPKRVGLVVLGVFLHVMSAQAQGSPDCTAMPPALSINDGTATWTLTSTGAIQRNGQTVSGGIVTQAQWDGGAIYVLSSGSVYRWVATDFALYGPTFPTCNTSPPPPPPIDLCTATGLPTSYNVLVGQSFTISWCQFPKDPSGNTVAITGFNVYRASLLLPGPMITTDTTPQPSGGYLSRFTRAESTIGTYNYEIASLDSAGESTRSAPIAVVVQAAPTTVMVPVAPTLLRVTVP